MIDLLISLCFKLIFYFKSNKIASNCYSSIISDLINIIILYYYHLLKLVNQVFFQSNIINIKQFLLTQSIFISNSSSTLCNNTERKIGFPSIAFGIPL